MELTNIEINFIDVLKKDLNILSHSLSSSLAHKIADDMAMEYQYVIDRFYNEYRPKYYKRHSTRGMTPGLVKTFKKYYKNPHNTIYYGGIEINADKMYNDYHDSRERVLESFLDGYHGRPSVGIISALLPYKHMLDYKERLINELYRYDSYLLTYAKDRARLMPYQLIKIM